MRAPIVSILALALTAAGCGSGSERPGRPKVRGVGTLFSLLAFEDQREVLSQPAERPVRQDIMKPRASGTDAFGPAPALIVAPPAVVRYVVPATHPRAVLQYALAVKSDGYHGAGAVAVEARLDGAPLFEHRLDCSVAVPRRERMWREHEAPLPSGGVLELSFRYEGDQQRVPEIGVGLLRAAVPFEVERRSSSRSEPNVLLVVIDTLRADRLHCYGNPLEVSPVIDGLAARGTRFARSYSSSSWTIPSTASLLTGRTPPQHGLGAGSSYYLADRIETLPELFQREGFTTAGFACNPLIARERNFDQGFEFFRSYRWTAAADVADDVAGWLDENRERRFFLYLHYVDPHGPYQPPPESAGRFVHAARPEGFIERPQAVRDALDAYYAGEGLGAQVLAAIVAHHSANYDAEIHAVDRALGQVLDRIESLGLAQSTIVCVTSDHGEEFLEHGWFGHYAQLFDESVHVPLVLAGPGVPRGVVEQRAIENRFVAQTLLRLAGTAVPAGMDDGQLLDPPVLERWSEAGVFLVNNKGRWSDFERRESRALGQVRSLVRGRWRLVHHPGDESSEPLLALFDLEADPECRVDVSAGNPQVAGELAARFERWMRAGRARTPRMVPPAEETERLLRSLGYLSE